MKLEGILALCGVLLGIGCDVDRKPASKPAAAPLATPTKKAGTTRQPGALKIDRTTGSLQHFAFKPSEADRRVTVRDATQHAYLDTRVEPRGKLVVFLHGAGNPESCGKPKLAQLVAGFGFHWLAPCYESGYGVGNCGDDIGGCRLEAFEGIDHHDRIAIARPDSIEERVAKGLAFLQTKHAAGDWQYFLDGASPRWSQIIISGSSHGASSSALIASRRLTHRVVSLAGPFDVGQAWLKSEKKTPIDRYFAFTHTNDKQHAGHLKSFADLGLLGEPFVVEDQLPPFGGAHRLVANVGENGHGLVSGGEPRYRRVWSYLYGAEPRPPADAQVPPEKASH